MRNIKRVISMILVVCMLLCVLPLGAFALTITDKPANGTTEGQPFLAGTGGSTNFRIPGIVTLDNGTLIAACDARWNHSGDGAGLDTIVSVSTDNGENWTYTFANYLGDNGNTYNNLSTCIIDPGIGTDGTTAYLIADLWPAGIALNTSKYSPVAGENGFDDNGNLLLRALADDTVAIGGSGYNTMAAVISRYQYYLDLETLELYAIGADGDTKIEGYTVDAHFNITSADGTVNTNLFFSDSPYQPYPTDYLYMTTSTDGLNWSAPKLLNLKEESEQTLLVGPGNGTYDDVNDHMVFTAYEHSSGYERACLIWQDGEGEWHRSEDATVNTWSSEATAVVLDDGTIRVFYRDGYTALRYTDYQWSASANNYVRVATEVNTAATVDYGCQLTAIEYSEQIDGKDVILVAGPTAYRRINGYIYTFLVDEDNSMELAYAYNVTPDAYAYSCLTEMEDGRVALLWEGNNPDTNAGSEIIFSTFDFEDLTDRSKDVRLNFVEFELLTGDTRTFTDKSGYYGDADVTELNTAVASVAMDGSEVVTDASQLGSDATYSGDRIATSESLYTFTYDAETDRWSAVSAAADGSAVYLYPGNTTGSGYPNRTAEYANLSLLEGYEDGSVCIMSNDCDNANQSTSYLYFDRAALRWDRVSAPGTNTTWQTNVSLYLYKAVEGAGSTEIPGYERVALADVTDGEYLVAAPGSNGSMYTLYPSTSTATRFNQIAKILGRTVVGETEIVFTGVGEGYTEVQIGDTVYMITVADMSTVEVTVPVGSSVTFTEASGNYEGAALEGLDTSVATVTLDGTDGTNDAGVVPTPVTSLTDGTYVIYNTRARKLVTNASASADAAAGSMAGLALNGTITNLTASTSVWTITSVDGGYTLTDPNGKYMTIAANGAGVVDAENVIHMAYTNGTWTLEQNGAYLNDAAGAGTTASGWQNSAAAGDAGSQFNIYEYAPGGAEPGTDVTFTGVYPGTTSVLIGRTQYNITVTGNIVEVDLSEGPATYVVDGAYDETVGLDTSVATAELKTVPVGHISTGDDYTGGMVNLADALFTFTANDDGTFEVSATAADGTKVYLNHFTSNANTPTITTPGKIAVSQSTSFENMFKLVAKNIDGSSNADRSLHFHMEAGMPYWNRCGSDTSIKCHEYLYRPVAEGDTSSVEIPGYVLVTDIADVVDGGKYLIVAKDNAGALYALNPVNSTQKFDYVLKLGEGTEVTFTGVDEGETTARLGSTIFQITGGHTCRYEAVVTAPTCTEEGYTTYTCSCGDSYVADKVPALGHNFENGSCTVCGKGIAVNEADGETYATLAEALAAAEAGQTVKLLGDCTEEKVLVIPGVTLDLNGKTLTAGYVVGFDTADVVDNAGSGKLIVAEKNVVLDEGNAMVPVYDGEGYILTPVGFAIAKDDKYEGTGIKVNAIAAPQRMAAVELLKNGAADNNLQVVIVLTWETDNGTASQKFLFTDEVVAAVYNTNRGQWNSYGDMFTMVITGIENVQNLKANIMLVSGTNAEYASETPVAVG